MSIVEWQGMSAACHEYFIRTRHAARGMRPARLGAMDSIPTRRAPHAAGRKPKGTTLLPSQMERRSPELYMHSPSRPSYAAVFRRSGDS